MKKYTTPEVELLTFANVDMMTSDDFELPQETYEIEAIGDI